MMCDELRNPHFRRFLRFQRPDILVIVFPNIIVGIAIDCNILFNRNTEHLDTLQSYCAEMRQILIEPTAGMPDL